MGQAKTQSQEVSVDREVAESMNLNIGDDYYYFQLGSNFNATVTSFREIEWKAFHQTFSYFLPVLAKNYQIHTSQVSKYPQI